MSETARFTRSNAGLRFLRHFKSTKPVLLSALALGLVATTWGGPCPMFSMGMIGSAAQAQSAEADRIQLRAKIKSAAEKLNDIASAGPDMIRAMFAGNATSASLLALDERSIAAQAELESAVLTANERGALSADESKELAQLGELAKKTRDPVKEDIDSLKSVPDLPIVGRDAAVRLAPKSQQDGAVKNAEAAKQAVGALVAAIRKLP
jgi:hypothetical protein